MGPYMTSNITGVKVEISVVLGSSTIPMHQLLRMGRGAVIELDTRQDDPVRILANDRPVAKGEIVIQGDKIAVSITDLLRGYQ
ncbi:MAG: flagellar motor switch protein FliN [Alphaproteobacteria bacterium]|nr:flagellar motor switch protein FliN [Alphaproteobacteria bacterium]MBV9540490.1 flagellar motor switch protein FliN [Alphaproteobacteria bacterium]